MKGDKYPGEVQIERVYVDKLDMEPLLRYMEEARKIQAEMKKQEEQSA